MDLSINYLGLKLAHPIMPGACPMTGDLDMVKKIEDAGASAIVMPSLFEEQIVHEQMTALAATEGRSGASAEATSYFPDPDAFRFGPDEYLDKIRKVREAVSVPVIASLNGTTSGGWVDYAKQIESAGAQALELNVFEVPTDLEETGATVEQRTVDLVGTVKKAVSIPLAVKLSAAYTNPGNLARRLQAAGAAGLVLFNRFYMPDIDTDNLEVSRVLHLSDSTELPVRLTWLAVLSGRVDASLSVTGGVHTVDDVVKSVMAGASSVQVVSEILLKGPGRLGTLRDELSQWLEDHEYESLSQMLGSMGWGKCPNPEAYRRWNYMALLQAWEGKA